MIDKTCSNRKMQSNGNECEKNLITMRISRQPSRIKIMIDQKQQENVEYFNYVGSIITNDARRTYEIKSRIAMTKAAFSK